MEILRVRDTRTDMQQEEESAETPAQVSIQTRAVMEWNVVLEHTNLDFIKHSFCCLKVL